MIGILIFCILGLAGFCMMAGEDMLHKTEHTIVAWTVAVFIACTAIGMIFLLSESIRTETVIDYEQGKYYLETEIYSDTTYIVKRCKE